MNANWGSLSWTLLECHLCGPIVLIVRGTALWVFTFKPRFSWTPSLISFICYRQSPSIYRENYFQVYFSSKRRLLLSLMYLRFASNMAVFLLLTNVDVHDAGQQLLWFVKILPISICISDARQQFFFSICSCLYVFLDWTFHQHLAGRLNRVTHGKTDRNFCVSVTQERVYRV